MSLLTEPKSEDVCMIDDKCHVYLMTPGGLIQSTSIGGVMKDTCVSVQLDREWGQHYPG